MSEEEEKGIRVSVTFPKMDAEWLQAQVEKGEYTSLAEVVRMCVRTMRTGGPGISLRGMQGEGVIIPTEVAVELMKNPDFATELLMHLTEAFKPKVAISEGKTKPEVQPEK